MRLPGRVLRRASLPEVVGDAARLFDPSDVERDRGRGARRARRAGAVAARGLERARAFTWERTARAHEDVYRELL